MTHPHHPHRIALITALLCIIISACQSQNDIRVETTSINPLEAQLRTATSWDTVEEYLKEARIEEFRQQVEYNRNPEKYYARHGGIPEIALDDAVADAAPNSASAGGDQDANLNYSETNNQEKGVDEADIIKTDDGHHVYALSGGHLSIIDSYPASDMHTVSSIDVAGSPIEMFVYKKNDDERRAVVFSRLHYYGQDLDIPEEMLDLQQDSAVGADAPVCCLAIGCYCGGWGRPITKMTIYNLDDLSNPSVEQEVYTQQNYVSSRMIDGRVRAVFNGYINGPQPRTWLDNADANKGLSTEEAWDKLLAEGIEMIEKTPLEYYLPKTMVVQDGQKNIYQVTPNYRDFLLPRSSNGRSVVDIVSFDLTKDEVNNTHKAILGQGSLVYASEKNIYVAAHSHNAWWDNSFLEESSATWIHKFDIQNPTIARYLGSGAVRGYIHNQFSMDEDDGYLRVATTESPLWRNGKQVREQTNHLFILKQGKNGYLNIAGSVENLAPTENIRSARFLGDVGYIVTFRQIDPLFTFDLSDNENPKKLGELKIEGFSTYIHPLDDDHLLTVGQECDDEGRCGQGMQIAIFDVSDLRDPKLIHKKVIQGYSQAQYNHKAFTYVPEKKLLAIPVQEWQAHDIECAELDIDQSCLRYTTGRNFVGMRTFEIDPVSGITSLADIEHTSLYLEQGQYAQQLDRFAYPHWYVNVHRSLTIGDDDACFLYSMSSAGIIATPVDAIKQGQAPTEGYVLLPQANDFAYPYYDF